MNKQMNKQEIMKWLKECEQCADFLADNISDFNIDDMEIRHQLHKAFLEISLGAYTAKMWLEDVE